MRGYCSICGEYTDVIKIEFEQYCDYCIQLEREEMEYDLQENSRD